jgi:hypothetical protein
MASESATTTIVLGYRVYPDSIEQTDVLGSTTSGSIRADARPARPGAARRVRLQSTPEGRQILAVGHQKVAQALGDHLLPLVRLRMFCLTSKRW